MQYSNLYCDWSIQIMRAKDSEPWNQLDLAQVRSAALEFLSWNIELHGLMLNAGIAAGDYKKSAQGHESHFAVNHLSHYLFAALLTDKLKETAKGNDYS